MDYFVEIAILRQAQYRFIIAFRNDIKKAVSKFETALYFK